MLVWLMVAFSMNAYVAAAVSLDNCAGMAAAGMPDPDGEMPCHGMPGADMDAGQAEGHAADCKSGNCACGDCKVPPQASLHVNKTVNGYAPGDLKPSSYNDMNESVFPYGIDYPPKPIA